MKIVLPHKREPQSGRSRGSEKHTFFVVFWGASLEYHFSSIFIDFGLHFGSYLAPWRSLLTIIFAKKFYIEFRMPFGKVPGPCQRVRRQGQYSPTVWIVDIVQCTVSTPVPDLLPPCGRTGQRGTWNVPRPDLADCVHAADPP